MKDYCLKKEIKYGSCHYLDDIILSERSQSQKVKYCPIPLI